MKPKSGQKEITPMTDVLEDMARAVADQIGDGYDNAFESKSDWVSARGEKGGRGRDINEPFQGDYDHAARAAAQVLLRGLFRDVNKSGEGLVHRNYIKGWLQQVATDLGINLTGESRP